MNCENFRNLLMNYFTGDMESSVKKEFEVHVTQCPDCKLEFDKLNKIATGLEELPDMDPPAGLDTAFTRVLKYELSDKDILSIGRRKSKIDWRIFLPAGIAASVLLFLSGFFIGKNQVTQNIKDQMIINLQNEVHTTKNLMILSLLEQQSASKRILAANYAEEMEKLEPDVMKALLHSLNHDYSANVRLATLEALSRYSADPIVRLELVKAFNNETDPILQLNMINLMVLMNEKSSARVMQKLVEDETTPSVVKEHARKGLSVLL